MILLEDIATWLQTQGFGTIGTDIFWDYQPTSPDNIILLTEYDSIGLGYRGIKSTLRMIQIASRNLDPAASKSKADGIFHLINDSSDPAVDFASGRVAVIVPKSSPIKIDYDPQNRSYWGFNIAVTTTAD